MSWWGGGGQEPASPPKTPPDQDEDVMEILSEEDADSLVPGSPPEEEESLLDDQELTDLREQFAQQESLLGQLKGVLRSNEAKLVSKEKEVQEYASRISRTHGRPRPSGAEDDPALDTSLVTGGTTGTGKIRLLRKQLEDARMKEQEELDRIRDLEHLVRDLQRDVAQREEVINQMREDQFSVVSFQASPPSSPFVMSPRGGSPINISSPNRSPPLGRSYDSTMSFEGYAGKNFTEKDEAILELREKNIELERKVLDLEESVKTKDELIRARTEAVALVSADFSAKGKSTVEELEDTRAEMKLMQKNFAQQEADFKNMYRLMEKELTEKCDKLKQSGIELAELEKLLLNKNVEIGDALSENSKFKDGLQLMETKLSNISNQLESLEKENTDLQELLASSPERQNSLKEKVEELEENLSKKQQEVVELKSKNEELEETSSSLSVRNEELSKELDEREAGISSLHQHVIKLQENIDNLVTYQDELQSENCKVKESLLLIETDLKNTRDQMESLENEKTDLQNQLASVAENKISLEVKVEELEKHLSEKQEEIFQLKSKNEELEVTFASHQDELQIENSKIKESLLLMETELKNVRDQMESLEVEKTDLQEQLASVAGLKTSLEVRVEELEGGLSEKQKEIVELKSKDDVLEVTFSSHQNELQSENSKIKESLLLKETELKNSRDQLESLEVEKTDLQEQLAAVAELKTSLEMKVAELEEGLSGKQQEIAELTSKDEELSVTFASLSERNEELSKELDDREAKISSLQQQVNALQELQNKDNDSNLEMSAKDQNSKLQMEELKTEMSELQQQQVTEEKLQEVKRCLEQKELEHESEIMLYRDQCNKHKTEVTTLQEQLEASRLSLIDHQQSNAELKTRLAHIEEQTPLHDKEVIDRNTQSADMQQRLEVLEQEALNSERIISDLQHELERMEEQRRRTINLQKEEESHQKNQPLRKNSQAEAQAMLSSSVMHALSAESSCTVEKEETKLLATVALTASSNDFDNDGDGDGWGGFEEDNLDIPDEMLEETSEDNAGKAEPPVPSDIAPSTDDEAHAAAAVAAVKSARLQMQMPEIEADIEDGWGDDSWSGGGWGENEEGLSANLKLTDDDGLRASSEPREGSRSATPQQPTESARRLAESRQSTTSSPREFDWQGKLMEKESCIESLQHELNGLRDKLSSFEQDLHTKDNEKEILTSKMTRLGEDLEENEAKLRRLLEEAEQKEHALESMQLSASTCMERLTISDEIIADYKKRIEDLTDEQKSLQLELVSSYEELEILRPLRKVQDELREAREKIDSLVTYQDELQSESSKVKDSLQLVETELRNISNQLESLENEKTDLQEQLASLGESNNTLELKVEELEESLSEKQQEIAELKSKNEELEVTFSSLSERNEELSKEQDEREVEISSLQQQVNELQESLDKDDENNLDLGMKGQNSQFVTEELEMEISELQRRLQLSEERLQEAKHSLEQEQSEHESEIASYHDQCNKRETEVKTLQEQLEASRLSLIDHQQSNAELKTHLAYIEEQARHHDQEVIERNAQAADMQQKLQLLEQEALNSEQIIAELRHQLVNMEDQRQDIILQAEEESHQHQPLDLAESNRPPPDVTNQRYHPDVAPYYQAPVSQPDLMPNRDREVGIVDQAPEEQSQASRYFLGQESQHDPTLFAQSQNATDFFQESANPAASFATGFFEPPGQSSAAEFLHPPPTAEDPLNQSDLNFSNYFGLPEPARQSSPFDEILSTSQIFAQQSQELEVPEQASKYFDQHQSASSLLEQSANSHITRENESQEPSSSSEAIHQKPLVKEKQDPSTLVAHYEQEILSYQQAIEDWKTWADGQALEFSNVQQSLQQYMEAFNNANAELELLRTEVKDSGQQVNASDEIEKLKTLFRAKELEVNDLIETIDRLQSEKVDLEQEMSDVSRLNEELRSEREEMSARSHNEQEILSYQQAIEDLKTRADGQALEFSNVQQSLQQYMEAFNNANTELELLRTEVGDRGQQVNVSGEIEKLKTLFRAKELEVKDLIETNDRLQSEKVDLQQEMSDVSRLNEELRSEREELSAKSHNEQEILSYQQAIEDWKTRADGQALEFSNVQQSLQQYMEAFNNANTELELLRTEIGDRRQQASGEIENLKTLFMAKELEVNDLIETIDRLQSEKVDLEQKMSDLSRLNEELRSEREEMSARSQNEQEILSYQQAIEDWKIRADSQALEFSNVQQSLEQYMEAFNNANAELELLHTEVGDRGQQASGEIENLKSLFRAKELEVTDLIKTINRLQSEKVELEQKMSDLSRLNEELRSEREEMSARSQNEQEILSYQQAIEDWKTWADGQALEFSNVQQSLQQYMEALNIANTHLELLRAEVGDRQQVNASDETPYGTKELDENDMVETIGRLRSEKVDLEQEMSDLLKERDTLQLKLSSVMRQYERQKESSSRAGTACSTPIPWIDNTSEIKELRAKIEELSKLNYNKDVELQKQKQQMVAMQVKIRHHTSSSPSPAKMRTPGQSTDGRYAPSPVQHL